VKDQSRSSTLNLSGRIEVLHAQYEGKAFAPHWHEEYAIGLIDRGVEQFEYQGAIHHAAEGQIILLNAGDVHTGEAVNEAGFGFRMLYVPESTFRELAPQLQVKETIRFRQAVMTPRAAGTQLLRAHRSLASGCSLLQIEALFTEALTAVLHETHNWQEPQRALALPSGLLRARDYLHDHLEDDVSVDELANVAGVSRYHFVRAFKHRFGLPPHAYQLQQRVFLAKHLLRLFPVHRVAQDTGFSDQSHFHRVFRALVGTTPGQYAQQFRPRRGLGT